MSLKKPTTTSMTVTKMRIKDNSCRGKEEFSAVSEVTKRVADKTLEQLEKEGIFIFPDLMSQAEDVTKDQIVLQSINETYRTGNIMGFIGYGDEQLTITSRFSSDDNDYFLQYMLNKVLELPNIVDLDTNTDSNNRLFNMLIFLFPGYLKAAMRKGVFKMYVRNRYNDNNIKGTINIARHIKENTPFIGNVAYDQREYSYDNYLMELVRHTIEFIKQKSYGGRILSEVKDEVKLIVETTQDYEFHDRRNIILENQHNMVRHAYYREYKALQHLCILILQYQKHNIGKGKNKIYGVLFDGAWLWEEYINTLIGECFYHPKNKTGEKAQYLFANGVGKIFPDFIGKDSDERIIADAKYKPENNINGDDYLQLLAYMFRFDAKTGYYLYPAKGLMSNKSFAMLEGVSFEGKAVPRDDVGVVKHGLLIPDGAESFLEFGKMMSMIESDFYRLLL